MSYPIQPYTPNSAIMMNPQFNSSVANNNNRISGEADLVNSLFGLANRLIAEVLSSSLDMGDLSAFRGLDTVNPTAQVFGISAMNVTQISCGPDGRPHIVQAHDERRVGPGGMWQSKKALRDPQRGIEKMQVGYFIGNRGEIIERRLDPSTRQYQQETQRYGMTGKDSSFSAAWHNQATTPMQRLPPARQQQYQYYTPQQPLQQQQQQHQVPAISNQSQFLPYQQQSQKALPAPSLYPY